MKIRRALLVILIIFLCLPFSVPAAAEPSDAVADTAEGSEGLSEQMSGLDLESIEKYLQDINTDISAYIPELNLKDMIFKLARGQLGVSVGEVMKGLLAYLFKELVANSRLLGQLLILAVLAAILQNIQSAFEKGTIGKVAWYVCYLVLLSLALNSFTIALQAGRQAIDDMVGFMHSMLPVLITLLTAMGNLTTAALFHPLTLVVLSTLSTLIKNVVFPLIFLSVILGLANKITTRIEISKLADLIKHWSVAFLGLFFTVFLGFMMVQGIAGSVADGVAMRTAKFGLGAFVPVVGKMFSDALEAVIGTSLLLKNAVGLVGIVAIFFICAFPVLKIVSLMLVYKIAAAVIQPIGDKLISDSLNLMGNSLTVVFAAVASVGIMFFFVIAIVIGAGNFSLMLR